VARQQFPADPGNVLLDGLREICGVAPISV
jgi:hypothetical protein